MRAFLEAGAAACGGYGTVVPGWDQWYFETLYLNEGVEIITEDNTCDLNSETAIEVTNMIKDWCDSGLAYFAVGTDASATMRQNFQDGKAFSVMHTSSLLNNYVDKCDFEVGMAWYPASSTGDKYSEVGGQVIGIPANNDQATKNAAWQFLQYCIGKESNMKWAIGTGYMPTRKSVLETDEGIAFLAEKPAFQCIFDNLDLINPRIQHGSWSELATTWKTYMDVMPNQNGDIVTNSDDSVTGTKTLKVEWNGDYDMYRLSDYSGGRGWIEDFVCIKPVETLTGVAAAGFSGPYDGLEHTVTVSGISVSA